jgi:hypothetical protein
LPDTDRTRYDIAYQRGRAQARSQMLFTGLALGAAVGAAAMFFLDPVRGTARRHEAGRQFVGRRNDLSRVVEGRMKDTRNRLEGAAIEAGVMIRPNENGASGEVRGDEQAGDPSAVGREHTASGTLGEPEVVWGR